MNITSVPHTPIATASELLKQLTQGLLSDQHPHDLLSRFAQALGALVSADAVALIQAIPGQSGLQTLYWHKQGIHNPYPDYRSPCLLNILEHPAIATLFAKSNVLAIQDLTAKASQHWLTGDILEWLSVLSDRTGQSTASWNQPRSLLAVVTRLDHCVNGVFAVMRSQPYQWMEADVQLLNDLAEPLAIAMSHAQFQQQVRQQRRYQGVIGQLVTAVRHTETLEHIFEQALSEVVSTLQVSRGFILLLKYSDPAYQRQARSAIVGVRVSVAHQWPQTCELPQSEALAIAFDGDDRHAGTWINHSFALSDCPSCQHLYLHPQDILAIPDSLASSLSTARIENDACSLHTSPLASAVMPSLVLVPLESHGKVLGYLAIQHHQPCVWQSEELDFLKLVAAQVGTAIIQSHTLQQVQSLVEERTAQLKHSLDVQAKLYAKTRQQIEQLQQLNQLKDEFLSTMSHELRTPLTSMTLAIRMLRQANLSEERRQKYLDILEEQCAQETSLINDLLALQKIETGSASSYRHKIDVYSMIRGIAQSFDDDFASRDIRFAVDIPKQNLSIRTDTDSLQRILTELLTNAKKYAAVSTDVHLQVMSERSPAGLPLLRVTLCNVGEGIDAEDMPYIFDKFRRGRGITQKAIPGTGLGLALVKGLVEHLNGTIEVSSQPISAPVTAGDGDGDQAEPSTHWETCFVLTLPQA